jgi:hypothetical protein
VLFNHAAWRGHVAAKGMATKNVPHIMQPAAETHRQQVSTAMPPQPAQNRVQRIGSKRDLPVMVASTFHGTSCIEHIHIQQAPCTKPHTTMM